jgi:hypothetical protein
MKEQLPSYRTCSAKLQRLEALPAISAEHYNICCKKISVLRSWRWAKGCPKHVELILEINKTVIVASGWCSILLYLHWWCTVKHKSRLQKIFIPQTDHNILLTPFWHSPLFWLLTDIHSVIDSLVTFSLLLFFLAFNLQLTPYWLSPCRFWVCYWIFTDTKHEEIKLVGKDK